MLRRGRASLADFAIQGQELPATILHSHLNMGNTSLLWQMYVCNVVGEGDLMHYMEGIWNIKIVHTL